MTSPRFHGRLVGVKGPRKRAPLLKGKLRLPGLPGPHLWLDLQLKVLTEYVGKGHARPRCSRPFSALPVPGEQISCVGIRQSRWSGPPAPLMGMFVLCGFCAFVEFCPTSTG